MRTNTQRAVNFTHEGAPAKVINPEAQLRRTVMASLLWENTFYEDGTSVADRVRQLVPLVGVEKVSQIAIEARTDQRLRHMPLLLAREVARIGKGKIVSETISGVIQRPDELCEFLSIYWLDGKVPLSAQVKKGLAKAFNKFNAYSLAKYNRDNAIKLRDVMFMCHAKPKEEQIEVFKQLADGTLASPDTWEVGLSGGGDKKEVFTRLLSENNLGYMALLRNLRNMKESGVDEDLVFSKLIGGAEYSKALPFRYISAAYAVPQWEHQIDQAMTLAMSKMDKLKGKTIVLVDVSGSMVGQKVSKRSEIDRLDAAAALAALVAGVAEKYEVYVFSDYIMPVPSRTGMALVDAIRNTQHRWTNLGGAVGAVNKIPHDRLIVITDEQSHTTVPDPVGRGYMINVATYKNGVGYHKWTHIDGWSESVIKFIHEIEQVQAIYE